MNTDDNIHNQQLNNSNGNPPVVEVDPAESDHEIVELPRTHLSARMWDSFKTYMLYPFMIAVAGSFGLSIGTNADPEEIIIFVNSILILFALNRLRTVRQSSSSISKH